MQLRTVFRVCPLDRKENRLCWRDSTNADVEVVVYDGGALTTDLLSPHCWNVMMEGQVVSGKEMTKFQVWQLLGACRHGTAFL